ncbi:MAG: hypothetical protein CMH12_25320 [Maritimibacter sp.]|mgnify:CR=1 FL=1|nr:hypothetical protein [Maritimibacter sp.]
MAISLNNFRTFQDDETGAMTIFGLQLFMCGLIFGGLAVDVGFAYKTRTELQVAADSAAHAALYIRQDSDAEEARAAAVAIAEAALNPLVYGDVLLPTDVQFGSWNRETQTFEIDDTSREAVLINTAQIAERTNAARSFLLNFVGIDHWDVNAMAVFETYVPACQREGFTAELEVDLQSNNHFKEGFCIHSNSYVHFNNNNTFEPGVIVSMPDLDDLDVPNIDKNPGLAEALREKHFENRILNRILDIIAGLENGDPLYVPDYITNTIPIEIQTSQNVEAADFTPGRIHTTACTNGTFKIKNNVLLQDVVLVTSCDVTFGSGVVLENVIIASKSTDVRSMSAANGIQVGRDDNCAEGGGAQLLTLGGMKFAAELKMFGGQLLAADDIEFEANANGIWGAAILSGGNIDGTSNAEMGFCGAGMEDNFEVPLFRLAG